MVLYDKYGILKTMTNLTRKTWKALRGCQKCQLGQWGKVSNISYSEDTFLAYIGIFHFPKVHFMPIYLYERPTLIPIFANQKKSKEDFCFHKERRKVKIAFSICFAVYYWGSAHPKQWEGHG